eukprot:COSAG05_NODE_2507_length_2971_cov_66.540738_3_plen_196_part_00
MDYKSLIIFKRTRMINTTPQHLTDSPWVRHSLLQGDHRLHHLLRPRELLQALCVGTAVRARQQWILISTRHPEYYHCTVPSSQTACLHDRATTLPGHHAELSTTLLALLVHSPVDDEHAVTSPGDSTLRPHRGLHTTQQRPANQNKKTRGQERKKYSRLETDRGWLPACLGGASAAVERSSWISDAWRRRRRTLG